MLLSAPDSALDISTLFLLFSIFSILFSICSTKSLSLFPLYFLSPLTQLRLLSSLWFFSLILWFWEPLPFLRKILQWISNLGSCLFGPARCPTWPSSGGKAEGQPHNDQCLRPWLIFHVQTGGWLPGPDKGLFKVFKCPPGVVKHGNLSLWSVLCNLHQKPHDNI